MANIQCIYKIVNTKNSRCYVGSTINFVQRKWRHFYDLRKGRHTSIFMQREFSKHGRDIFEIEIIEIVERRDELIQREQFWLDALKPEYNNAKIAASVFGVRHSPKTILKNKERNTGFGNGNARITEEQAKQIAGMLSDFTQNEIALRFGVHRTTIQRLCARIGCDKKKQVFNEKTRKLFSDNAKKNIGGINAIPIYMFKPDSADNIVTRSMEEAAVILGITAPAISWRFKIKDVSLCNGYFISKYPIDAAAVAHRYRNWSKAP